MRATRQLGFVIWTIAWTMLLFLVVLELGVRSGLVPLSFQMWEVTYQLDRNALFRIKPRSHPTIGAYGNRLTGSKPATAPAQRMLVLGDSFAYGVNVPPEAAIAAEMERQLGAGWEVLNFGVPGYGPDQALAQLPRLLRLQPRAVVLVLFPGNDFNDLVKNRLYRLDAAGHLERDPRNRLDRDLPRLHSLVLLDSALTRRSRKNSRFLGLYRSFFHDHLDWDFLQNPESEISREKQVLMRGVLRTMREQLAAADIPLAVLVVPSFEAVLKPDDVAAHGVSAERRFGLEEITASMCAEEGIPCVDLTADLLEMGADAYDLRDHHLSASGYAQAAARALQLLQSKR